MKLSIWIVLAVGVASAQDGATTSAPTGNGLALLRQVSTAARNATGWRAEGYRLVEAVPLQGGAPFESGQAFKMSKRGPLYSRYELPFSLTVCDGSIRWTRTTPFSGEQLRVSESRGVARAETCDPPVLRWGNLLDSVKSANIVGTGSSGCTLVLAEYQRPEGLGFSLPTSQPVGAIAATICIDAARQIVLSERVDGHSASGNRVTITTTYKTVERDPAFREDEFKVEP